MESEGRAVIIALRMSSRNVKTGLPVPSVGPGTIRGKTSTHVVSRHLA